MSGTLRKALFVPRNSYGGYNCSIEVIDDGNGARATFLATQGGGEDQESSFLNLMGEVDRGQTRFSIGKVVVRFSPLEFSDGSRRLNFEEIVNFLSSRKEFRKVS